MMLTHFVNRDLIKRYQHDPHMHNSYSTHSTTSERTWEVYAGNGVLDLNLPHTITSASLAPLAQQKTQQRTSNKYIGWIVNHFWPVRKHHNQSSSSNLPHTSIQIEKTSPQPPPPAATKGDDMNPNASYSSSLPTLLHSPTAYLIGASESDTMVDDRDILKDIVLEQPLRSRSSNHPSSSILSAPIFLEDQLDEAVPWRVLEATAGDDDIMRTSITSQHHPTCVTTTNAATMSHSLSLPSDHEVDSWLELNDDPPSPSSRMSQWFTRRGDSFEIVRERMARSSKSIRRWCRQQQQLQQSNTTTLEEQGEYSSASCEVLSSSNDNPSRLSSSSSTDQQQQQQRGGGGSLDLRWSRTLSGSFFDPTALQAVPEETADIARSREKRRDS